MQSRADHYIVCGGNALARRLVEELKKLYRVPVVAIVPPSDSKFVVEIVKLLGDDAVVEAGAITDEALRSAGIVTARAIAFVDGDDQGNIHTALRSKVLNKGLVVVIRMYNQRLGQHIEQLIKKCTVLSASATAAPAFANAALQRPHSVEVGGRSLRIALGAEIDDDKEICVVAEAIDPSKPSEIRMLPDVASAAIKWIEHDVLRLQTQGTPRAVLQYLDREPVVAVPLLSRIRWRVVDALRFFTSAQLRLILATAVIAVLVAFGGIWARRPFGWAAYETLLDVSGSAVPDVYGQASNVGGAWQRVFQVAVTFSGILLIPVVTAIFLESTASQRAGRTRQPSAGIRGHVVVVGLGNVGTRVAMLLRKLDVPVVCIERDAAARGIAVAAGLDIPVLVGDRPFDEALRQARVAAARAVLALTGDDVANLEAALEARAIQPKARVVVRLFDDEFAKHVYDEFGNAASRSVSYLAAPAFAAAMMGQEVLGTLSVYRHVLLIAEVLATEESGILGNTLRELDKTGEIRVLALRRATDREYRWQPADKGRRLEEQDSIVIAATRAGLGALHGAGPED